MTRCKNSLANLTDIFFVFAFVTTMLVIVEAIELFDKMPKHFDNLLHSIKSICLMTTSIPFAFVMIVVMTSSPIHDNEKTKASIVFLLLILASLLLLTIARAIDLFSSA